MIVFQIVEMGSLMIQVIIYVCHVEADVLAAVKAFKIVLLVTQKVLRLYTLILIVLKHVQLI
jgi:hypothetical protein